MTHEQADEIHGFIKWQNLLAMNFWAVGPQNQLPLGSGQLASGSLFFPTLNSKKKSFTHNTIT